MSSLGRILRVALSLGWAAAAAAADGQKNPLDGWTFSNGREFPGATGELRWNDREGHGAPGCAEVVFSFEKGGNYVAGMMPVHDTDNRYRRARLWLKKPGGNRITFRATDDGGQTFQKFVDYTYPGWQQFEIDLATWVHSWGGAKDGKVRWPIRAFGVLIENDGNAKTGSYFVDDIEFLPAATATASAPSGLRHGSYPAARFTADEGWRVRGPVGCRLDRGVWVYNLPAPGAQAALDADLPIYGDPKKIRLRVLSDGSGNELTIKLGSHFQTFTRSLGTITGKGEQVLEITADNMSEWQYYGGENDGVRRLPLRLCGLNLVRRADRAQDQLKLLSLDVEATYAPDETLILVPDGRCDRGTARFEVTLRNLASKAVSGTLYAETRGLDGRVAVESASLKIPPAAAPVKRRYNVPMKGAQFQEMAFRFVAPGLQTPEASVTVVATPPVPENPVAVNPIGVGVYLYRFQGSPTAGKQMRELAQMAQRAGVKWTREEIQWHATEPARGQYKWDFYDDLVQAANEHGINVYGLLAYWSEWAYQEKIAYTEKGVEEYAKWAAEVVRRYKGRIRHWEIWNEPNIFFWSGPKELYLSLLKKAYEAIKKEDPEAQVLGCSTAGIDTAFIQKVLDGGAPFDILTIHPYRGLLDERGFIDELKRTQQQVGGRPVWITEMGWPTAIGHVSERQQAGLVARTYLSALASGAVGSVSWYDFRDDGDNPFYNEHRFGLLRRDLRPKAGYRALATIGHVLARHKVKGVIEGEEGLLRYMFQDNEDRERVIAAWSSTEDRALWLVPDKKPVRAIDAMGQPLALDAEGRFAGMLPAGLPVYFIGPPDFTLSSAPLAKVVAEPAYARPGEEVRVRIEARPEGAEGPQMLWPVEWQATEIAPGQEWSVRVPADQPQGAATILAEFRFGDRPARVPATVRVQPAVIRL